jgi:hypothetical protein
LAAYVDGLVPFLDPLDSLGFYDSGEIGIASMQVTGEIAAVAFGAGASLRGTSLLVSETASGTGGVAALGRKLIGKGGLLNSNRYLRVGLGRNGGLKVLRVAGSTVQRLTGKAHIDL